MPTLHHPLSAPFVQQGSFEVSEQPGHEPGAYLDFLQALIRQGYEFIFFHELDPRKDGNVILRHDVDFDTKAALQMAEMETMMGVRSTYFFLLGSKMYNLLNPIDAANVKAIRDMGHDVSLHFDATIYSDIHEGLQHEITIFKSCFQKDVRIISFHRPDNGTMVRHDRQLLGVENTYQSKYFRDIKYMSDSTGAWRYGHPFDTDEFKQRRNLQLLIHPIWWMYAGTESVAKLESYLGAQVSELRREVARNCIPFRQKLHIVEAT